MHYHVIDDALDADAFEKTREGIESSSLLSQNPLEGTFEHTRGFGMIFREDGRAQLLGRFPFLRAFIECSLSKARQKVRPLFERARVPNAFYLNALSVKQGGEVAAHFDTTLWEPAGSDGVLPDVVSVLYLRAPSAGGALTLFEKGASVCVLPPRERTLAFFRGELCHGVSKVEEGGRLSLVLEQYHFDNETLLRLPKLRVQSRAGFGVYLERG